MSIKITIKSKDFEIQFDYKINVKVKRYLNISVYSPRFHTCSLSLTMTAKIMFGWSFSCNDYFIPDSLKSTQDFTPLFKTSLAH